MYEEEKALMGKTFKAEKEYRIKRCKIKPGDILTVIGYGSDICSDYVEFKNKRLPKYTFTMGTWLFKRLVKEA